MSAHVPNTRPQLMFDRHEVGIALETSRRDQREHTEASFDAKLKDLGVADELKGIPGITTPMLMALGEQGIKTIEDFASCATDDLVGWIEEESGKITKHRGLLHRFWISPRECEAMILCARVEAGWIEKA